jgi:23S rRNA pseudouridine1911/1915/1917 synthase
MQGQLHRTSRTRAQAIVRASAYDASGRKLGQSDRVRPEQHILLWRLPWDEKPVPREIPILYEDDHLLAVDKPALLPVHPTARYHHNTLIKVLQASRPPGAFLSLGHRLDRETSGVLLVSKTRECDRAIKRQLERREGIEKTYVAITWGVPDRGDGARRFRYERSMELDTAHALRVKMRTSESAKALFAATEFETGEVRSAPVASAGAERRGTYARVVCRLETGRQHQIRVHLAALGAPVVGDKLYGPDDGLFARAADDELTPEDSALLEMPRHALHAYRLALPHPISGEPLRVEAPLPRDMVDFWSALDPSA